MRISSVVAVGLVVSLSSAALANHIPGHSNSDPIFPVPIPGQEFFDGGILFVTAIGPQSGREIVHTSFDITFVSDGATPASNLLVNINMGLFDEFGDFFSVSFALLAPDLPSCSGAATFTGTFETDALNGTTTPSFFPPYSIVSLQIGAELSDGTAGQIDGSGYFVDSFINFELAPVPAPGSAAAGLLGLAGLGARRRR